MNKSVEFAIEKIKSNEQDMEAKLKKKREHETALAFLSRAIRDEISQSEKSDKEQIEIKKRLDKLRPLLEIEKMRRDALSTQLKTLTLLINDLRAQSDQGIRKVWSLRSSLCETVQNVSDECGIWALLTRPVCTESLSCEVKNLKNKENIINNNDGLTRLQAALDRREKAMREKEYLQSEPDSGEEFVRQVNIIRIVSAKKSTHIRVV